jgi:hypothetical protein
MWKVKFVGLILLTYLILLGARFDKIENTELVFTQNSSYIASMWTTASPSNVCVHYV